MKKVVLFILITYCTISVYSQNTNYKYNTDSVTIESKVEFFIYNGPYGDKKNIKEPAIKFILSVKNFGTNPIPNLGATNRSQYVNLYINDSLNNPVSLYNGVEVMGDHLLKKGDSDTYIWWVFESEAYSNIFTVQWKYLELFSRKLKINMTKKTIVPVK